MPSLDDVRSLLLGAFPQANVEVTDLTGTQDHLQVVIVSPAFAGKTRVEQHKLVYAALGDLMHGPIHALALTTRAA
jgi:stress-induced morphogen